MIPFLLPIGDILRIYVLILQYIRHRNVQMAVQPRNNVVNQILMNFLQLCMDYIHMIQLMATYLDRTRTRSWCKPHVLLKLMIAYRCSIS